MVDLSHNKLSSIIINSKNILTLDLSSNIFTDTVNLKISNTSWIQNLILANNSLTRVNKFYTITKDSLPIVNEGKQQKVDISYNQIKEIDGDSFTSFYQLKKLDLEGNLLKNIDHLRLPVTIRRLHLANNHLTTIPLIVENFKQMRWLDLSGNQLNNITKTNVFANFVDFRYLNLSHNKLTDSFSSNFLINSTITETFDLSGNRLVCTCSLKIGLARVSETAVILGQCTGVKGLQPLSEVKPTPGSSRIGLISKDCNFCILKPCLHGGVCFSKSASEKTACQCKEGFSGFGCQHILTTTTTTTTTTKTQPTHRTTTTTTQPTRRTAMPSTRPTTTTPPVTYSTTIPLQTPTTTEEPGKSKSEKYTSESDVFTLQKKLTTSIAFNIVLAIILVGVVIALVFAYWKYRIVYNLNQFHTQKDTFQMENSTTVNSV